MTGRSIGQYQILGKLGEGGMGEVYRAHDTRLQRDVALKILPPAVADAPDRRSRFEREARTLAALTHPNIATIHGIEESDHQLALVMELIEGPTLAERLQAGALPLEDALPIARQIADALQAAHERGIVHRDLKPANVKVAPDGAVKVLDFGLAKAFETGPASGIDVASAAGPSVPPTMISPAMTQMGMILGTAAYMAPEQAKGQPVDRRADVWAFGVVLYEMITGRRLFDAGDVADTLAAVLTRTPDWQQLPPGTPAALRRLLRRCLARDPRQRLDSMGAVRLELEEATSGERPAAAAPKGALLRYAALVLGGVLIGAAGSFMLWRPARSAGEADSTAPIVSVIEATPDAVSAFTYGFALSPDATTLVYAARSADGVRRLWRRSLSNARAEVMQGTEDAAYPFWSPGGREVAFIAAGMLKVIAFDGGPARRLTEVPQTFTHHGSWSDRGGILLSSDRGVLHVDAARSTATPLPFDLATEAQWLPDGQSFLFLSRTENKLRVMWATIEGGKATEVRVLDDARAPGMRLSSAGFLLFNHAGVLSAQRFNAATRSIEGPIVPVGERVGTPRGWFAVSVSGRTAIALNPSTIGTGGTPGDPVSKLRWIDRRGQLLQEVGPPARYWTLNLSRDGLKAAVNPDDNVWVVDTRTGIKARLLGGVGAVWSPDGRTVVYRTDSGLAAVAASGEGTRRPVVAFTDRVFVPADISPDGRLLAMRGRPNTRFAYSELWLLDLLDGSTRSFVAGKYNSRSPAFSPDGRWMAYSSDATGRPEIYVRSMAGNEGAVPVSTGGGEHPRWSQDGRELFFLSLTDQMMVVDMSSFARTDLAAAPRELFRMVLTDITRGDWAPYAPAPDARRFLVVVPDAPEPLTLIQHLDATQTSR